MRKCHLSQRLRYFTGRNHSVKHYCQFVTSKWRYLHTSPPNPGFDWLCLKTNNGSSISPPNPGFEKLCLSDQMALLCNSWMEILLTNVIYRSSLLQQSKEKPLFFADGFIMTRRLCIEKGVLIYDQITNVVDRLRPLGVSKGIAVLLKAMILFNAG